MRRRALNVIRPLLLAILCGSHSGPVYVTIAGTPSIADQPKAAEAAKAWLARLDELEALLSQDRLSKLAGFPGRGDGVTLNDPRSGRDELRRAIGDAPPRTPADGHVPSFPIVRLCSKPVMVGLPVTVSCSRLCAGWEAGIII